MQWSLHEFINHLREKQYIAFIDNRDCPNRLYFDGYSSTSKFVAESFSTFRSIETRIWFLFLHAPHSPYRHILLTETNQCNTKFPNQFEKSKYSLIFGILENHLNYHYFSIISRILVFWINYLLLIVNSGFGVVIREFPFSSRNIDVGER